VLANTSATELAKCRHQAVALCLRIHSTVVILVVVMLVAAIMME
jgi:hypothetical protein